MTNINGGIKFFSNSNSHRHSFLNKLGLWVGKLGLKLNWEKILYSRWNDFLFWCDSASKNGQSNSLSIRIWNRDAMWYYIKNIAFEINVVTRLCKKSCVKLF